MTLRNIEGTVDALYQGISQQPPIERLPNQCLEQVNMSSAIIDGVRTRPGSFYKEEASFGEDVLKQRVYFKGADEEFSVAFGFNGTEESGYSIISIQDSDAVSHPFDGLVAVGPAIGTCENLKFLQISETEMLILNPDRHPVFDVGDTSCEFIPPVATPATFVFEPSTGSAAGASFEINGVTTTVALTSADLATGSTIAAAIKAGLDSQTIEGYTACTGNVLTFSVAAEFITESFNGDLVNSYHRLDRLHVLENEAYLPTCAEDHHIQPMKVGDYEYTMMFTGTSNRPFAGLRTGYWEECPEVGSYTFFNKYFMPILLTHYPDFDDASGEYEFVFSFPEWGTKTVGGDNCIPSFMDARVNDFALEQGRLILVHDKGITTSRSNEIYDFFPITTKTAREDTVIDLTTGEVDNNLFAIVSIATHLLVLGTKKQYLILGSEAIGLSTRLSASTEIPISTLTKPVVSGNSVFILSGFSHPAMSNYNTYSKIIEFIVKKDTATPTLIDYTRHVPQYIPKDIKNFGIDVFSGTLVLLPESGECLYVCQFQKDDSGTITQQAWSQWEFDGNVNTVLIRKGCIELGVQVGTHTIISVIPLSIATDTPEVLLALDSKVSITAGSGGSITLPSALSSSTTIGIHTSESKLYKMATEYIPVAGDTLVYGVPIDFKYVPTIPYPKLSSGVYIRGTELLIDRMYFWLKDSGPIQINGYKYGLESVSEARDYLQSRSCDLRLGADREDISIEITNTENSYLPVTILSYDWFGRLKQSGQRM